MCLRDPSRSGLRGRPILGLLSTMADEEKQRPAVPRINTDAPCCRAPVPRTGIALEDPSPSCNSPRGGVSEPVVEIVLLLQVSF